MRVGMPSFGVTLKKPIVVGFEKKQGGSRGYFYQLEQREYGTIQYAQTFAKHLKVCCIRDLVDHKTFLIFKFQFFQFRILGDNVGIEFSYSRFSLSFELIVIFIATGKNKQRQFLVFITLCSLCHRIFILTFYYLFCILHFYD